LEKEPHDIVLLDLSLDAFAIDLTRILRANRPQVRILLLVTPNHHAQIADAIAAGAHGCVLEEVSLRELKEAIERLLSGEYFCSPKLIESMFARMAEMGRQSQPRWRTRVESAELTQREFEILCLVAEGLSNKQMARRLSLSLYTIKNHVHNILQKLQVGDRFQAVEHLREKGWLSKNSL
jgi:DNA-binding NarL/FixJ family response regulator